MPSTTLTWVSDEFRTNANAFIDDISQAKSQVSTTLTSISGKIQQELPLTIIPIVTKDVAKAANSGKLDKLFGINFKDLKRVSGGETLLRWVVSEIIYMANETLRVGFEEKIASRFPWLPKNPITNELLDEPDSEKPWAEFALDQIANAAQYRNGCDISSIKSLKSTLASDKFQKLVSDTKKEAEKINPLLVTAAAVNQAAEAMNNAAQLMSVAAAAMNVTVAALQPQEPVAAPQQVAPEPEPAPEEPDEPETAPLQASPVAEPEPQPETIMAPTAEPKKRKHRRSPPETSMIPVANLEENEQPKKKRAVAQRYKSDPTAECLRGTWIGDMFNNFLKLAAWTREQKDKGAWEGDKPFDPQNENSQNTTIEFDCNGLAYVSTFGKNCKAQNRADNYLCIQKGSRLFKLCKMLGHKTDKMAFRSTNTVGDFVCENGLIHMAIKSGQIKEINEI
jgi:outer membrane biosynthesis protein TonB